MIMIKDYSGNDKQVMEHDKSTIRWNWKRADSTDRGKKGTKKNMLTDSKNIALFVLLDGANRHDKMFLRDF